jgi:Ca-activated chloride channel homolog
MRTILLITTVLILGIVCIQAGSPRNKNGKQQPIGQQPVDAFLPGDLDTSKLINWVVKPGNAWFLRDANHHLYLYVRIVSGEVKQAKPRMPLNVSLVLDRSGSMRGEKIKYARQAAKFLVDQLNNEDYLSIVNYDNDVQVTSSSQRISNKEYLRKKIDEIMDRGSTNLSGGMLEGYTQVRSTKKEGYVNRVLLLTDGLANAGITEPEDLRKIVEKKYTEEGIALSTFGLGADYNEDLLTMLAETGRANYYFIDSADKIPALFASELKGLLSVVAQNALVQVDLPRGVTCEKVYGYPYEVRDGKVQIRFNDIYAKDEKAILIKLAAAPSVNEQLTFNCRLQYIDALDLKDMKLQQSVIMKPTNDAALVKEGEDKLVQEMIALFESTEEFDKMMADVDAGNYEVARQVANISIQKLEERSRTYNSTRLQQQTIKMKEYALRIDSVRVMQETDRRIYQKSNKSINYEVKKGRRN